MQNLTEITQTLELQYSRKSHDWHVKYVHVQ